MATVICILLLGASAMFASSGMFRARLAAWVAVLASIVGLAGLVLWLTGPQSVELSLSWPIPLGRFAIGLDALSAAFLVVVLVIPALGAVYATGYFSPTHPTARRTRIAYGLLPAAMILVVIARDAMLLLVAWEVMALAAFFAISADDHESEVRESGWVYLVATHIGTLCLIAAFAMLAKHTGVLSLRAVAGLGEDTTRVVAALFFVGFGMKAGLVPLHVWLPGAHANAPSHVSAVMSGVVLKMGLYGLMRMATLLPELDASTGAALLGIGAMSTVLGAAFAVGQVDIKRLLAYSSIDNIGIATMGIGLAIIGRAHGRAELVVLGIVGATLHVWNHAVFKPLLFFVAGSVIHETSTRSMDRLGGLAGRLPRTAQVALIGAVALAGLPPLNGFVSELVLYTGLFRAALVPEWAALAAPMLAMGGALTLVAMLKLYGSVFLGTARLPVAGVAHRERVAMVAPMQVLAVGCGALALGFPLLAPSLRHVAQIFGGSMAMPVLPIATMRVTLVLAAVAGVVGLALWGLFRGSRRSRIPQSGTWDCGYAAPSRRMQYTATSLAEVAMGLVWRALLPVRILPRLVGVMPGASSFAESVPDPVLDRGALPIFRLLGRIVPWLRLTQQGKLQVYILYILVAIIALMMVQ